jgi:hypothetical protein
MTKTKTWIVTLLGAAACAVAAACGQGNQPASPVTVTVSGSSGSSTAAVQSSPANSTTAAPASTTAPAADGSTGNEMPPEYCAQNEDPGCPAGSYVGPDAIPNPNGEGSYVPCEGTICTNPNHGAGPDPADTGGVDPGDDQP